MTVEEHVPVLIVGAGTVGLAAALFLATQGVAATVVERRPGVTAHPRAIGVGVRTVELLREVGLEGALQNAAATLAGGGVIGGETLVEALAAYTPPPSGAATGAPVADAPFSPTAGIACAQDQLDPLLHAAAVARGATIRYGVEVVGIAHDADGVTATVVARADGARATLHADYLIAADGGNSTIRRALGVATSGPGALGNPIINTYFAADLAELVRGRPFTLCTLTNTAPPGLLIAIRHPDRWVYHRSYDPAQGESPADFSPQRCRDLIRAAIGSSAIEPEIISILPWQTEGMLAAQFRAGRAFLAGDAAHVVPPTGGYGMNTGIADAHNLAWKLALVLAGKAPPALLDSYEAERRPAGQFALDQALLRLQHPHLHWDAGRVAERAALGIAEQDVVHLGFGYRAGALCAPRQGLPSLTDLDADLDGAPGTRLPHAWIERDGARCSTLDLGAGGFRLLAGPEGEAWAAAASRAAQERGIALATFQIGPDGTLRDPAGRWTERAAIGPTGALLVRPDGIIAWRATGVIGDPAEQVRRALARSLGS